jgi:hypothetical protein
MYQLQRQHQLVINNHTLPVIPTYIAPETIIWHDTNKQYQIIHHTNQASYTIKSAIYVLTQFKYYLTELYVNDTYQK